ACVEPAPRRGQRVQPGGAERNDRGTHAGTARRGSRRGQGGRNRRARPASARGDPRSRAGDAATTARLRAIRRRVGTLRAVRWRRPVSPRAWLPIGLMAFKAANPAAIWVIFISSIWPMIINTAVGVQRVPQDYLNVARVLNLSEWKVVTKILFPAVLPYMLTGVRLSIGVAWLVIVAAEMLTGGVGIGFWVW